MLEQDAPSPLVGLELVDRSELLDGCGEVDQVPRELRELWGHTDPSHQDQLRRLESRGDLEERLIPYSGMLASYCMRDATPPAVPFLVRLVQDPRTRRRWSSMSLLMRIADAVDEGPAAQCWGQDNASVLFRAAGKALARTNVTAWFDLIDQDPDPDRRRDVLHLLAIISRCDDDKLLGRLWDSVLNADHAELLVERLICTAYATAKRPDPWSGLSEPWARSLKNWLEHYQIGDAPPSPEQTAEAVRTALAHLPSWIDRDTVHALDELIHEELLL